MQSLSLLQTQSRVFCSPAACRLLPARTFRRLPRYCPRSEVQCDENMFNVKLASQDWNKCHPSQSNLTFRARLFSTFVAFNPQLASQAFSQGLTAPRSPLSTLASSQLSSVRREGAGITTVRQEGERSRDILDREAAVQLGRSNQEERPTDSTESDENPAASRERLEKVWRRIREDSPELLDCSEGREKKRIAVLLSGGVDSSVALHLLLAAGHHCTCFYLKIWFQEDFRNFWSECPWEEDLMVAEKVCKDAGVELRVVHLTSEYWDRVVSHTVGEIRAGRTPNPDILCNSRVKFGAFLEREDLASFDRIASGHYARVHRPAEDHPNLARASPEDALVSLSLSADEWKDQTYFLSQMTQGQLSRALFPLGALEKPRVRQLAAELALPNSNRKDSQGICFLGKVKFTEFVAEHLGEWPGRILEAESGDFLGMHSGFWFYTIGQRQGLGLSGGPWYVVAKDTENNVVFASRTYFSGEMPRDRFVVGPLFNWIAGRPPEQTRKLTCKVRHGPKLYGCQLEFDGPDRATVVIDEGDQGLATGQYAAFYDEGVCLGSAMITDVIGDSEATIPMPRAKKAARSAEGEQGPKAKVKFDGKKRNVFGDRAKDLYLSQG